MKPTALSIFSAACLMATVSGASQALANVSDACFTQTASIEVVQTALASEGWALADREDAAVQDHITWMGMPQYFAGDTGGQDINTVLDMKRMSAIGILRKKDLPNAKTRILSRMQNGQVEVAKIAVVEQANKRTSVLCTFSVAAASVETWTGDAFSGSQTDTFVRLSSAAPLMEDAQSSKDIVALNKAALGETLGIDIPTDAIIETYLSFLTKEN